MVIFQRTGWYVKGARTAHSTDRPTDITKPGGTFVTSARVTTALLSVSRNP